MGTLKIYRGSKIIEQENYSVDSIQDYLSTLTSTTITNFNYVRHALDIVIKVVLNRDTIVLGYPSNNYYVEIDNNPNMILLTKKMYYFVRKIREVAPNTAELTLHMDVLNTFKSGYDFTLSNRTLVKREHKDRFTNYVAQHVKMSIDRYPENINPILYRGNVVKTPTNLFKSLHLVYVNSNYNPDEDDNVVRCLLFFNQDLYLEKTVIPASTPLNASDIGIMIYYAKATNQHKQITYIDQNDQSHSFYADDYTPWVIKIIVRNGQLNIYRLEFIYEEVIALNVKSISFESGLILHYGYDTNNMSLVDNMDSIEVGGETASNLLNQYKELDTSDSRIIKSILIPYAPTSDLDIYSKSGDTKAYLACNREVWKLGNFQDINCLELINLNTKFRKDITFPTNLIPTAITNYENESLAKTYSDAIIDDPKIYHSEFYQPKFYYDSFSKDVKCEEISIYYTYESTHLVRFVMTSTINSKFLFDLTYTHDFMSEDYPNILAVARSNECVLYNSQYINYIRSGFNYDVKAKNTQIGFNWFTTIATMTGGVLSVIFGSKTLGAGLIASSVVSLGSAINNTINAERNMDKTLENLKRQAVSVEGSDDVDLMEYYCSNELKLVTYEVSPRMRELLNKLFYLTGYVSNENKIPNFNTRILFNYVECDAIFSEVRSIPKDCLDELTEKMSSGVFYIHNYIDNNVKKWDFTFSHENWESKFFEEEN